MNTPNQDLRKLAEEIYEHNLGYEGESVVEWTEARLREAESERYQLLGLETGRDDSWIERAAKRICEETGLKNKGLVEELIASVHLPIADQQLSRAFVIIQRLRQSEAERDRLARALVECRTLAAVVADADAKAPGKREVARDQLGKIDSLMMVSRDVDLNDPETRVAMEDILQAAAKYLRRKRTIESGKNG